VAKVFWSFALAPKLQLGNEWKGYVFLPALRAFVVKNKFYTIKMHKPALTPNFFKMIAIGQNPVNADCSKLAPTKAVNHNHNSE
jgi:hypothetical protein